MGVLVFARMCVGCGPVDTYLVFWMMIHPHLIRLCYSKVVYIDKIQ